VEPRSQALLSESSLNSSDSSEADADAKGDGEAGNGELTGEGLVHRSKAAEMHG
jgi:hypothetical protein